MILLSDRSPNPRDADDLTWRFNGEADAEMGLRSGLGGFISLVERGLGNPGGADYEVNGRAIAAATRARSVDLALAEAGVVRGYRVAELARIHFGTPPPPWTLGGCGPTGSTPYLSPLLELLPEAREAHERSNSRLVLKEWLSRLDGKLARGNASKADQRMGRELQIAGTDAVHDVVLAYGAARRKLPRFDAPRGWAA